MLQSAESTATSPEKKVRKMRDPPFNKKSSGSTLYRAANKDTSQIEDLSPGSASNSPIAKNEVVEIAPHPARAKPHRANPNQNKYVASGYESDNDSNEDAELSDFVEVD
jgi:DNA topoisomerase II